MPFDLEKLESLDARKTLTQIQDNQILFVRLDYDQDAENPCEDQDGVGMIYSFNRKHTNYVDPNSLLDEQNSLADFQKKHPFAVLLSYFEHGQCLWGVRGQLDTTPDFQWDGTSLAGYWEPDDSCLSEIHSRALRKLLPEGVKVEYHSTLNADGTMKTRPLPPEKHHQVQCGDKMVTVTTETDPRYCNVITLTLPGGLTRAPFKSFTSAYRAAARWLKVKWSAAEIQRLEQEVAQELAAAACDTYTKYCNGEVYSYDWEIFTLRQTDDGEESLDQRSDYRHDEPLASDSCCGFLGWDFVVSSCRESLQNGLNSLPAEETVSSNKVTIADCPFSFNPLRPWEDDNPDGYPESNRDFMENNQKACLWFLKQLAARDAMGKKSG